MTATRTSTDSAERVATRPRVGVLGIMQELYDEMLPGITERQAGYAQELGAALGEGVDVQVAAPARNRAEIEATLRGFENDGLDGVLVVMLTYGPGMRVARALSETRLPVCLANIQPVAEVTTAWDMGDLTYNQGIHGAQDTANAMVRAGRTFHVVTGDWGAPAFRDEVTAWARAAAAITRWRSLKIAVFGYAMNGMGDIRVDEHSFLRTLGPQIDALPPGAIVRAAEQASDDDVRALLEWEDSRFEVDPRLSATERESHARMQLGIRQVLDT